MWISDAGRAFYRAHDAWTICKTIIIRETVHVLMLQAVESTDLCLGSVGNVAVIIPLNAAAQKTTRKSKLKFCDSGIIRVRFSPEPGLID
jgi:hypothetical protein